VVTLPLEGNAASIQRAVAGDCGNPLFAHAATRTAGPWLGRASALAASGAKASQLRDVSEADWIEAGTSLWSSGWAAAVVGCDHLLAPSDSNLAEVRGWGASGAWAGEKAGGIGNDPRLKRLHGLVERRNGRMVEERLNHQYPLQVQGPGPKPPLPPPLATYAAGVTVVVMTYATSAKAAAARRLLTHVANLDFSSSSGGVVRADGVVREVVLLWNGPGVNTEGRNEEKPWAPPADYLAGIPRARLVIAQTNDLQNRMDMNLVKPATAAVMALDDDSPPPGAADLLVAYRKWAGQADTGGAFANVGLDESRGPPVVVPKTSVGQVPFCTPVFAYLGHAYCVGGRSWVVENPFIYHEHWARSFSAPSQAPLRTFVRLQPSHPDDLAFGTFVNWASGQPAFCSDQPTGRGTERRRQLVASENGTATATATAADAAADGAANGAADRASVPGAAALWRDELEASPEAIPEASAHGRGLAGLSGGPAWLFLRSHGAMWVLFWFGGFHAPKGCWVSCRAEASADSSGKQLPPRYTIPEAGKWGC
jgi:hypothetical protein